MANIALFGGTFNPFHIGHYEILNSLCEQKYIDKVFIIPDKIPPHKTCDFLADDNARAEMCELMAQKFSKAEVNNIEFEREGKSYTYDTVMLLKRQYPRDNFYVVCGGDMLMSLTTWYNFPLLMNEVAFIAFNRDNNTEFDNRVEKLREIGAYIIVIEKTITTVSSSQIRGKLDKDLLPAEIFDYLIKKGIYDAK